MHQTHRRPHGRLHLLALASALTLVTAAPASAQADAYNQPIEEDTGGTYIKAGLAHWQGDIFSSRSLTRWNGSPFGAEYNLTSLEVEVESYFDRPLLVLSGWSIGYRKDDVRTAESGHMFHASGFGNIDLRVVQIRTGGGIEWGIPSLNFDTTTFDVRSDGALRYNHTYPAKNADLPAVGTKHDGAVYPFVEVSLVERPGRLLFELGMRINIVDFMFDTYEVGLDDQVTHTFNEKKMLMPMLFVDVGLKLF